jgi:hypothetical protein
MVQKVQVALLALIAAALLALVVRPDQPPRVVVEPCVVVVNPTQRLNAEGRPVYVPDPLGGSGC